MPNFFFKIDLVSNYLLLCLVCRKFCQIAVIQSVPPTSTKPEAMTSCNSWYVRYPGRPMKLDITYRVDLMPYLRSRGKASVKKSSYPSSKVKITAFCPEGRPLADSSAKSFIKYEWYRLAASDCSCRSNTSGVYSSLSLNGRFCPARSRRNDKNYRNFYLPGICILY